MTHYFQPGREEFRQAIQSAMARLLMNGAKSRDERLREIIGRMTQKTLKEGNARALSVLDGNA